MRSLSAFLMFYVTVYLVPSTETAGLFGTLLGNSDSNNDNYNNRGSNTGIPLISSLGLGSNNRQENNQPSTSYNQYTKNNANRGLLSPLLGNNQNSLQGNNQNNLQGVNENYDRPNVNNLNNNSQLPNTDQQNDNYNVSEIKKQINDAEKRLERLQELNRLKEHKRLEEINNNQGQRDTEGKGAEVANNNGVVEDSGKVGGEVKAFTKKRIFYIAQPVVPQDEAEKYNQTVYYVD